MGRMKEMYINNLEMEEHPYQPVEDPTYWCSDQEPQILCPNCQKGYLRFDYKKHEGDCGSCGAEFVLVEKNTVRYK